MSGRNGPLLVYGPDRLPLQPSIEETERLWGYRPFHGVISSGLRDKCTPGRWLSAATTLDDPHPHDPALATAARGCGVLTFEESLAAAQAAAERYSATHLNGMPVTELWHMKEGHTSSVWRATYAPAGHPPGDNEGGGGSIPHRLAVNIPRDEVADRALAGSASVYADLQRILPTTAPASVLATIPVALPLTARTDDRRPTVGAAPSWPREQTDVAITAVIQRWIDDAYEINALSTSGATRLVAVERFLPDADAPARIGTVRGHPLTVAEHESVGATIGTLLRTTARRQGDSWLLPGFDVNHGDWVWHHGIAVIVACREDRTQTHSDRLENAVREGLKELCDLLDEPFSGAVMRGAAKAER